MFTAAASISAISKLFYSCFKGICPKLPSWFILSVIWQDLGLRMKHKHFNLLTIISSLLTNLKFPLPILK